MVHIRKQEFVKSTVYDVLRRPNFNWRALLLSLSAAVIRFFISLSNERRETMLIIDDSIVERHRSKKAELLARVCDRRKKDWLALLSTNIDLADTEIVRIYGKRWDIEVFFKMSKQYLHLEKVVQLRNLDGLIAHTAIALMCYLFLSYRQRCETDDRTFMPEVF
jgi:hypothetical protein